MYSTHTSSMTFPLLATQYPLAQRCWPQYRLRSCHACTLPSNHFIPEAPRSQPPKGVGFPDPLSGTLNNLLNEDPGYRLCGEYGGPLKAVGEALVDAATSLLRGPTYTITEGSKSREVPRMAFRLEIVDEFRIDGLAQEIYRDLIRYGLFMRDNRGKSVRGAFVPRLYLRRLLLPYCTLALSKRDSVSLSCNAFRQLLLKPDVFKADFKASLTRRREQRGQIDMFG